MATRKSSANKNNEASSWMKHLDRVVETITEGVLIIGRDGKVEFANSAAERILGAAREDIIGRTFKDAPWRAVSPDGKPLVDTAQLPTPRVLSTGKAVRGMEFSIRRANGDIVWLSANAAPLRGDSGELVAVVESFADITGRKDAEEAVRASRERYRSFVQNFQGVAFQGELNGKPVFLHGAVEEMTGYTEDDFRSGKIRWEQLAHPDDAPVLMKDAERMRSEPGFSSEREYRMVRKDGRVVWVRGSVQVIPGRHGGPPRVQGAFYDVTARKEVEQALADSERFLTGVFESIQDGISVLDRDMKIVKVNPAIERWYAHAMPLVGKKCYEAYHGREKICEVCPSKRVLDTGEPAHEVIPMRGPTGDTMGWLDIFSFPMRDKPGGEITGVIEYVRDVSEQRRAANALRESEERYRTLAETAQDVIFIVDRHGEVTYVNSAGAKFYGVSADAVAGTALARMFPTEVVEHASLEVRNVFDSGEPARVTNRVCFPRGEAWLDTSLTPIRDGAGEVTGVMGISHDISDIKGAEETLAERDRAIRQAYVDVIGAVTGNRLVLMTPDEVEEALGDPLSDPATIVSYEELCEARAKVKQLFERSLPQVKSIDEFIVGVSEALTNAVKHAGGGTYQVFRTGKTAQVAISDTGPGIDFKTLPKATLEVGFSTAQTLGAGFTIMMDLSDRVLLSTQPSNTTVVLEVSK